MRGRSPTFSNVRTAADDPAIIAFTSGTTGRSKGTVHFHRDLLAVTDTYARRVLEPEPDDIFIGSPPLAFTYALGGLVLFPMRFGASAVLLEQATPPLLLEGIQKYRATISFTSPTGYRAMLRRRGQFDLSSLRKCVSAGETLPAATFDAWLEAVGIRLMDGIGSTEMLHMFIGCTAEDARPGSTGRVVPGYRAIVVDDEGKEVPVDTVGRLAGVGPDRLPLPRRPREPAEVRAARLEPHRRRVSRRRGRLLLVPVAHRRHDRHAGTTSPVPRSRTCCCRTRPSPSAR